MAVSTLNWANSVSMLLLHVLILTQPSHAFFPTTWRQNWFGNYGISHEQQTQTAFEQLAKQYFPNEKTLSRSMTIARDSMALANANVDQDYDHSAFHCDGENFDGAQQRLTELKEKSIKALRDGNDILARNELGSALHTLQDFYSHSNWVEMGNTRPHPDLGRGRPIAHAMFENATCTACGPTMEKDADGCPVCLRKKTLGVELNILTSGYAFAEDRPIKSMKIPETKCHHGGYIDNSWGAAVGFVEGMIIGTSMPGINKDSLNCGFSPHNYLHHEAVNVSVAATIQFIDEVKNQLTEPQVKLLFGVGRTFSFFFDFNTIFLASMALMLANSIYQNANNYKIARFDGKRLNVETISAIDEFRNTVNRMTKQKSALPSPPCVGAPLESVLGHVRSLRDGSTLFLMAGALPPDNAVAADIVSTAYEKDITIHSFRHPFACPNSDNRIHSKINGVINTTTIYDDFAAATGGSIHFTDDPLNLTAGLQAKRRRDLQASFDNDIARDDGAKILAVEDSITRYIFKPDPRKFSFPIDSSISALKISLKASSATLTLIGPDGVELRPTMPPNTKVAKINMVGGEFVTIRAPEVGNWTAVVDGSGAFALDVYGNTAISMSAFDLVRVAGRPGHQGLFPIKQDEQPTAKTNITAVGRLEGEFKNAEWEVRTPAGVTVQTNIMTPGNDEVGQAPRRSFLGTVQLAKGEYFVYAKGRNVRGEEFQRAWRGRVKPK